MTRRWWEKEEEGGKEIDKEDGTKSKHKSRTTKDFESLRVKVKHTANFCKTRASLIILAEFCLGSLPLSVYQESQVRELGKTWKSGQARLQFVPSHQLMANLAICRFNVSHGLPCFAKHAKHNGWYWSVCSIWLGCNLRLFLADFIDTFVSDLTRRKWYLHDWSLPRSRFCHARVYSGCISTHLGPWRNCPEVFGPAPFSGPDVFVWWLFARVCGMRLIKFHKHTSTYNLAFASFIALGPLPQTTWALTRGVRIHGAQILRRGLLPASRLRRLPVWLSSGAIGQQDVAGKVEFLSRIEAYLAEPVYWLQWDSDAWSKLWLQILGLFFWVCSAKEFHAYRNLDATFSVCDHCMFELNTWLTLGWLFLSQLIS